MGNKNRGKTAEDEVRAFLNTFCTYVRRVHDTRSFQGAMLLAPKVHADFEGVLWGGNELHFYVEVKSSKNATAFPFRDSILETQKGSGDKKRITPKLHQWGWTRTVHLNATAESALYMIVNRYSQGAYYIILMDWPTIEYWTNWLLEKNKKSVPWEHLKRYATMDKILYQEDGISTIERYCTEENIDKMGVFLGRNLRAATIKRLSKEEYPF